MASVRMGFPLLVALVLVALLTGCREGAVRCEDPCWPGPRIGPTCPALCEEPVLEGPCTEEPPPYTDLKRIDSRALYRP